MFLDVIFFVVGIFILAKGEVKIAPRRTLRGTRTRLIGLLYVSILPLVIFAVACETAMPSALPILAWTTWVLLGFAVLVTILLVAFAKGESTMPPGKVPPTPDWLEKLSVDSHGLTLPEQLACEEEEPSPSNVNAPDSFLSFLTTTESGTNPGTIPDPCPSSITGKSEGKTAAAIPVAPALTCVCYKCGQVYKLGEDAVVITTGLVLSRFVAVTVLSAGPKPDNRDDPDLVGSCDWETLELEQPEGYRECRSAVARIRSCLSSGHRRWWKCNKCGQTQQYSPHSAGTGDVPTAEPRIKRVEICFFADRSPYEEAYVISDLIDHFQYRSLLDECVRITTSYGRISGELAVFAVARAMLLGMNVHNTAFRDFSVDSVSGVMILERAVNRVRSPASAKRLMFKCPKQREPHRF